MSWTIPKKKRRQYDGLPSVTQIIDKNLGWNKAPLMAWANKQGRVTGKTLHQLRDETTKVGSLAHHLIECFLVGTAAHETQEWHESDSVTQAKATCGLKGFCDWWKAYGEPEYELVDVERTMRSENMGYAGTCDMVLLDRETGQLVIADVKTGKVHPEALIQIAAYAMLLSEEKNHAITVKRGTILHVNCEESTCVEKPLSSVGFSTAESVFDSLLHVEECRTLLEEEGGAL